MGRGKQFFKLHGSFSLFLSCQFYVLTCPFERLWENIGYSIPSQGIFSHTITYACQYVVGQISAMLDDDLNYS
jgi:hypothetical protein